MMFSRYLLKARQASVHALQEYAASLASMNRHGVLKRLTELAFIGSFIIAFSLLASKVPPSGDDWTWGSSIGLDRLKNGFIDYNGRYLGNLLVLTMTRLGWVTPILQGLGFGVIIVLLLDITRNRTAIGYVTLMSLVFLMPAPLWREAAVWVPGYANFATGSIAILLFLRSVFRELSDSQRDPPSRVALAGIFALAVGSQLLAEHVTVYLLLASLLVMVLARVIRGRVGPRLICWAAGFAVGFVLMFSSEEYRRIASASGSSYKELGSQGGSLPSQMAEALRNQVATNGFLSNKMLILVVALLVVITSITKLVGSYRSLGMDPLLLGAAMMGVLVVLVTASKMTLAPVQNGSTRTVLAMAAGVVLVLLASLLLSRPDHRMIVGVSVISIIMLNAPLLIARPISARTFLPTFVLLLMIVSVFTFNLNFVGTARLSLVWIVLAASAGMLGWLHLQTIYSEIREVSDRRLALIREQADQGASDVTIERLPRQEWMKRPDPPSDWWFTAYKLYYDLPPDLSISLAD